MSARLKLNNISHRYGRGEPALCDFSINVEPGELVALLGPSGCGKTTALKIVAGLLCPETGEVLVDGNSVLGTPPEERWAAMVFQKSLLFPHMDVAENVGFGLRMRGAGKEESGRRVRRALGAGTDGGVSRTAGPANSPAASSSAWRSREPSSPSPGSCS